MHFGADDARNPTRRLAGAPLDDLVRAQVLAVLCVLVWTAVEGLAAQELRHYSTYQVVWTRYAVHLLFMLLVWGMREPASLIATRRPAFQLSRSLLMLGMPASWAIAASHGVAARTILAIFWLAPLMVLALAAAGLGERPRWITWLMAGCGFVGTLLVLRPKVLPDPLGFALSVGMGLTFSLYIVMTRSLRTERTRANLFYTALGVFVILTPLMPLVWIAPSLRDLVIFTVMGLLGLLMLWLLDRMAATAPVSLTAPFLYLRVVLTAVISAGGGHWRLGRGTLVGIGCILLSVMVAGISDRRHAVAAAL